ncbi:hypothetical protein Gpo141_00006784 [Globisporangium polare]
MLYDHRHKRGRQAMAVAPRPTPPTTTARSTAAVSTTRLAAPIVRAHAATGRFREALPRHSRQQQQQQVWMMTGGSERTAPVAGPVASFRSPTAAIMTAIEPVARRQAAYAYTPDSALVESEPADVQKMIRHAHRARRLLLDRLTVVNLRRSHRCELLEEIARLKKVLASLQEQVDATTRNVAKMDRLVHHLQTISSIFTDAIEAPTAAPLAVSGLPVALTVGPGITSEEGEEESDPSPRAAASPVVMAPDAQLIENELEPEAKQAEAGDTMQTPVKEPLEKEDDAEYGVEVNDEGTCGAEEGQQGKEATAAE